jgi:short-subunit dehydrogenase
MDLAIANKVAVVCGARQMGAAISVALAREGCRLLLCARNEPNLAAVRDHCLGVEPSAMVGTLSVDLSDANSASGCGCIYEKFIGRNRRRRYHH